MGTTALTRKVAGWLVGFVLFCGVFETGSLYVVPAVLEVTELTKLTSNLRDSSAGIKGMCHHNQPYFGLGKWLSQDEKSIRA